MRVWVADRMGLLQESGTMEGRAVRAVQEKVVLEGVGFECDVALLCPPGSCRHARDGSAS